MKERMGAIWGGAVGALSFLYAYWACAHFHKTSIDGNTGPGLIGAYLIIAFYFIIAIIFAAIIFGTILKSMTLDTARLFITLFALTIFLLGHGVPSIWGIIFAGLFFLSGIYQGVTENQDASDLNDFLKK